jgi:hypothetical protein
MAQVKFYGHREHLTAHRSQLSDLVHGALTSELGLPETKRFHRFLPLDADDLVHPADRSERYTIVEIVLFSGRRTETKKAAIRAMYAGAAALGLDAHDHEIVLQEAASHDGGIRGVPADELTLDYRVET